MDKRIIVFYLPSEQPRNAPYIGEKTSARHDDFISYFPKNIDFYLVTHLSQYQENDRFRPHFKRVNNTWREVKSLKIIEADLILGMTGRIDCTKKYINPIRSFCIDKREIEKVFPEITLSSITCETYQDIEQNFHKIPSIRKVLKPCHGKQGKGIIICEILPNSQEITGEYPYLLQEFFDTSAGFEKHSGVHDFRTIIINGKTTGSFLRVAPPGVLTANVSTGATIIDYEENNIPASVQKVIETIESYCAEKYPQRYYSIDIGVGRNGEIKIFELNASPALSTPSIRKHLALHIIKNILKIT